jgi:hypothetical protein
VRRRTLSRPREAGGADRALRRAVPVALPPRGLQPGDTGLPLARDGRAGGTDTIAPSLLAEIPMRPSRPATRLAAFAALLALRAAAAAAPASPPTPADLDAFVKALPSPGHDRAFLALPAPLVARLGIDPAALHDIDPGVACDPGAQGVNAFEAALGRVAHVDTSCTPDGRAQGLLQLADGSTFITVCGAAGLHVEAHLDVQVGDHALHASTRPAATHEPAHDCSGWTRLPR